MNHMLLLNIFLLLSVVALAVAFIIYQIRQVGWLRHHGKRVVALVTSIHHEVGKTQAGFARDNYYLTATWTNPRTGRTHTFWTWIMNHAPEYMQGSLVPVLIDPKDPEHYLMEL